MRFSSIEMRVQSRFHGVELCKLGARRERVEDKAIGSLKRLHGGSHEPVYPLCHDVIIIVKIVVVVIVVLWVGA